MEILRVTTAGVSRFAKFHAGAVSVDGCGILLPGVRRSGKSVLTLGLLLGGAHYLSEDLALMDRESLELIPEGRGVSVRSDAPELFPELAGRWQPLPVDPAGDPLQQVAFVPPAVIGSRVSAPCPLGVIVFPTYDARMARAELTPMRASQGVLRLLEHCVTLGTDVGSGIDVLVSAVKRAEVYALRYADAREGCRRILTAVEVARPAVASAS